MLLRQFEVSGFKSLRRVSLTFSDLTVLVGPNGAGKSNVADALAFLADAYRTGLPDAIEAHGGLDSLITLTQHGRSPGIRFSILGDVDRASHRGSRPTDSIVRPSVRHSFELQPVHKAKQQYHVVAESIEFLFEAQPGHFRTVLALKRSGDQLRIGIGARTLPPGLSPTLRRTFVEIRDITKALTAASIKLASTELAMQVFGKMQQHLGRFSSALGSMRVYQLDPDVSRDDGEKSARPELSRYGQNLPSVLNYLRRMHPSSWRAINGAMRDVMPDLDCITIDNRPSGNLAVFFKELGYRRAWKATEVSDGTIRTLALLTAIFDPRTALLVLEEPENSLHPWVTRQVVKACTAAVTGKQIVLTTHSPVVMKSTKAKDVILIWKNAAGTEASPLPAVDPELRDSLLAGDIDVFDTLDSGIISVAVPQPLNLAERQQ